MQSVLMVYPGNMRSVQQIARALHAAGLLFGYATACVYQPDSLLGGSVWKAFFDLTNKP